MEILNCKLGIDLSTLENTSNISKDKHEERIIVPNIKPIDQIQQELAQLYKNKKTVTDIIDDIIPSLLQDAQSFQKGLDSLSKELDDVRGKSVELSNLIEKNSGLLNEVEPIVNALVISPHVITNLLKGKIDSQWCDENIDYVEEKLEKFKLFADNNVKEKAIVEDFDKLNKILEIMKLIIIERSKKYIVYKIKSLRSTKICASQVIQKDMIQVCKIYKFIYKHNLSLALELRQAYIYTMRWYYENFFKRYIRSLTIMPYVTIDQNYRLGNGLSNTNLKSYYSYISSAAVTNEDVQNYFQSVDKRIDILTQEYNTVMVSQIAENSGNMKHYLEIGFKNLNLCLVDNATSEHLFLQKFFFPSNENNEGEIGGILEKIFQPTFNNSLDFTSRHLILNTFDIYGVLICIRIAQRLQYICGKDIRNLPECLNSFLDAQLIILWPKFQQLVDYNTEGLLLNFNNGGIHCINNADDPLCYPQEITVQFGQFLKGILKLAVSNRNTLDERSEPIYNSMIRLRNDFEIIMTKCSKKTKSPEKFMATNYTCILNNLEFFNKAYHQNEEGTQKEPLMIGEMRTHFLTMTQAFTKN